MRRLGLFAGAGLLCLPALSAGAIDLVIDYSFDTNGFFNPATSDGMAARTTLEQAASDFSALLTDTFSAVSTPADFQSQQFDGIANWTWNATFTHPGTGANWSLTDPTIGADQFIIYAGGRSLGGDTLGIGGAGGFGWSSGSNGGGFTSAEITQINNITAAFSDAVEDRGESSGFSAWGGSITFDTDAGTNWHLGLDDPSSGESDFYSVAVHELAHALGLGGTSEWNAFINSSGRWTGSNAVAEYGGTVPLDPPDGAHWAEGTMSNVFGTSTPQEAAMDPNITTGTRKLFTDLDVAALDDIGWSIDYSVRFLQDTDTPDLNGDGFVGAADLDILLANWGSTTGTAATGDANGDGVTNQLDLDIVDAAWGTGTLPGGGVPEPGSLALLSLGGLALLRRRR
ncbi:MAG: matrixin family metalloprotease [Planctomycetota bacterium]